MSINISIPVPYFHYRRSVRRTSRRTSRRTAARYGGYYGRPYYYGGAAVATGVAVGATAIAVGSIVASLPPNCSTVVVNGVAKTYAMTGWRVGWMIGPSDVVKASANFQSHATSNVANVSQMAALAAVEGPLDAVVEMREAFDRRRRTMYSMLSAIDGVVVPEPQGAFYAFPKLPWGTGMEFVERAIAERRLRELTADRGVIAVADA